MNELPAQTRRVLLETALRHAPVRIAMRGRSMHPDIREGMTLELEPPHAHLSPGNIIVFRARSRFVAHRVVAKKDDVVVCAGDAQPDCLEFVPHGDIIAGVRAVYDGGGRRVDTAPVRARGIFRARFRAARALAYRLHPRLRPRAYAALAAAMSAALRCDGEALDGVTGGIEPWRLHALAVRHRCAAALFEALERIGTGDYAAALRERLRTEHWRAAARAPHFHSQVLAVTKILEDAGVPAVLLKGAQRAFCGDDSAAVYSSQDVDVLVPPHRMDDARNAFLARGYFEQSAPGMLDYDRHHHAAPLYLRGGQPVELHRALSHAPLAVPNAWDALEERMLRVYSASGGATHVLDALGNALHLTVHCLQRPALREIALLAAQLRRLQRDELSALKTLLAHEREYAVPLTAAAVFAARMAGIEWNCNAAVERYVRWMLLREDLPLPLRARTECADAWLGFPRNPVRASLNAALSGDPASAPRRLARAAARLAAGAATAAYLRFMPAADPARRILSTLR